jgi:class 3 adenylate cyclase/pimeloyl-ACP methyl ester carboxylesterase
MQHGPSQMTPRPSGGKTVVVDDQPETHYTTLGKDRIAYQVFGEGPPDVVYMSAMGEAIDARWEWPPYASFLRRLGSFSRLIMFDRRGMGASDPLPQEGVSPWEGWVDDVRTVLDEVGSERATILGTQEAGPIAILFAATQPERTQALVLVNANAYSTLSAADSENVNTLIEERWGTEALGELGGADSSGDRAYLRWAAKTTRMSCSPREVGVYLRWINMMDVRSVLPTIRVPTLVLHRKDVAMTTIDQGLYIAGDIPGARFVEVPGNHISPYNKPSAPILDHIEEFLTGVSPNAESDRALAAVLFTDIIGSTERASALGDRRWRALLETHDGVSRTIIEQHRGRLIKTTGDGVLATFDGPGRAIRGAFALRDALHPLGIEIRGGLHTGEIELREGDVGGIGVHVAARVLDYAGAGELVVSGAVPLLVTGSGLTFDDRGEHELKGIPGTWRLFAVEG